MSLFIIVLLCFVISCTRGINVRQFRTSVTRREKQVAVISKETNVKAKTGYVLNKNIANFLVGGQRAHFL